MLEGVDATAGWVDGGWIASGGTSTAFGVAGGTGGTGVAGGTGGASATALTLDGHCL